MSLKRSRSSPSPTRDLFPSSTDVHSSRTTLLSQQDLDAHSDSDQETDQIRPPQNAAKKRKTSPSVVWAGHKIYDSSSLLSTHHLPSIATSSSHRDIDRLSALSDELLIRILHLLPIKCILTCQLVSRRFHRLAGDAQVWKGLYWARWVRPRLRMLPGEREKELVDFSSRRSKWLDEGRLLRTGIEGATGRGDGTKEETREEDFGNRETRRPGHMAEGTDWKARYKLRHNWSIGAAEVREIGLGLGLDLSYEDEEDEMGDDSNRGENTIMARLMDSGIITVDVKEGLRAWDLKRKKCFAQRTLADDCVDNCGLESVPTCLCVDSGSESGPNTTVVVGFRDGRFEMWKLRYDLQEGKGTFSRQYRSQPLTIDEREVGQDVQLSAVAYAYPYLLTITAEHLLALYVFEKEYPADEGRQSLSSMPQLESRTVSEQQLIDLETTAPRLLTSLKSHTCWPPLCLSIRSTPQTVIASIAYVFPTYLSGWSVGLQELHLTHSGTILRSRLASAVEQGFRSLLSSSAPSTPSLSRSLRHTTPEAGDIPGQSKSRVERQTHPTSLSYSHPYLLAGNRNNTLSLYLVTSNNEELKISNSTTLWGHTSSVSEAYIGGRGKAVSISARGDELRVWELEGGLGRKVVQERSVLVRRNASATEDAEGRRGGQTGVDLVKIMQKSQSGQNVGWLGFNDEVVIVLKEDEEEGQALIVYDFT